MSLKRVQMSEKMDRECTIDDSESIILVCGADEAYAMHMAVMLTSVLENYGGRNELIIYAFDNGLASRTRQVLQDVAEGRIRWIDPVIERLVDLKTVGHISVSTYLRLLIPKQLPESVGKVIYLDVDLVVENDITELWETDIEGWALGAIQDLTIPYVSDPSGLKLYEERGLDANQPYFNAGVLLINADWWRNRDVSSRVFRYLRQHEDSVRLVDQDGLNFVLANDWKSLDRRWNVPPKVMNYESWNNGPFKEAIRGEIGALQRNPYIIHYIGGEKPWMYGEEVPWQDRYFHYLRESGWFSSQWKWKEWRLRKALSYYRRCLSTSSHRIYNELKRYLVPVARLLGVARSSRR